MVVDAVAFTESVTVTVIVSVPTAVLDPTVTMPVTESIVIPVVAGEMLNRYEPVPRVAVKADETLAVPKVVVTLEPPLITTIESIVIATLMDFEIFRVSVAVTLSLMVPTASPGNKVITPLEGSMEI